MDLGCDRKFEKGDFVALRRGVVLCHKCDENIPAPIYAIWLTGVVDDKTKKLAPNLKCGDCIPLDK